MSAEAIAPDAVGDAARDRFAWTAALPTHLQRRMWRGNALGSTERGGMPSGHAALDRELPGGGWPRAALTELLLAQPGSGELRLLAPILTAQTAQAGRHVLLVAPPYTPYAPTLVAWGVALERLIWIPMSDQPGGQTDALWAAEQALRHQGIGAVLMWLPSVRAEALRRLQVAAQDGDALAFLMRPRRAASQSSPAPLRIVCEAAGDARPDRTRLRLTIVKRRGPVLDTPIDVLLPLGGNRHADEREQAGKPIVPMPDGSDARNGTGAEVGREVEADHAVDRRRVAVAAA
jgi:protein ImuA